MMRLHPRSTPTDTLCPYTTVFRSGQARATRWPSFRQARARRPPTPRRRRAYGKRTIGIQIVLALLLKSRAVTVSIYNAGRGGNLPRSEEHTSELQSLMRNSYDVCCVKKKPHTTP